MIVPADPDIYHITHIKNLPGILNASCLWSDARRIRHGFEVENIGYPHIKKRRLKRVVPVAAGGVLGDYVPFNFCPRSVMLFVVNKGHPDYGGGQDEIVHLRSTARTAISTGRPWAFTDRHADLDYAEYHDDLAELDDVAWDVMPLAYWSEPQTKEVRQAEFLVHDWLQWGAILEVGVINDAMAARVRSLLGPSTKTPVVSVRRSWYY
jgi:ssDNA thymidine ADP-ribosyltransferase, DarT